MKMTPAYRILRQIAQWGVHRLMRLEVEGLENIPETGPFILVPNHQSALDPLVVQGICPRMVSTMTKSTQFAAPVFRWLLLRGEAFPVRRYRVDAQSVRVFLRRLRDGRAVCIYPEGERTWDGTLQPFRRGALRLLLRCGVPVIPVGIEGTYDVWPRWASKPRAGRSVHLRFGEPLDFGEYRNRAAREAALPEAERALREALVALSGSVGDPGGVLEGSAREWEGPGADAGR